MTEQDCMDRARELATKAAKQHPNSVDDAVDCLRSMVVKEKIEKWIDSWLRARAYREMIQDVRDYHNRQLRQAYGWQGGGTGRAKVVMGAAVAAVAKESILHNYSIGGTKLGQIRGDEINDLIDREEATAAGHTLNADFLKKLAPKVPLGSTIADKYTDKEVEKIFSGLLRKRAK